MKVNGINMYHGIHEFGFINMLLFFNISKRADSNNMKYVFIILPIMKYEFY